MAESHARGGRLRVGIDLCLGPAAPTGLAWRAMMIVGIAATAGSIALPSVLAA
ncbi:hypothetical protein G6L37_07355 [Agrobacterium rubi]|nr:hypothetical protein [Agrobacterium rubi]NTF25184.1 hypothetical protein [Agrobacterium rubi]